MKNKKTKRGSFSALWILCGVVIVLGFIWMNTFIHQHSFEGTWGDFGFLRIALISALCTAFYYWLLFSDSIFFLIWDTTQICMVLAAVSGIIMMASVLLELGTDGFSLYSQSNIIIWRITIPKKLFYDIWAIVLFPTNISIIFKALRKEQFQKSSIIFACVAIAELTLQGILIFRPMPNIYQVDMIILNTITLGFAIWAFVLPNVHVRKGNAVATVILYAVMRSVMLPLQCDGWGQKFQIFMCGKDFNGRLSGIREITHNAAMLGTSGYILNSEFLHGWLKDRNKPVAQLLYYGGWISVTVFISLLIVMVCILFKLLGLKNSRVHSNWLMFATAGCMISSRALFGTLYNFGVPFPVGLPFLANNGSPMDVMAFALILICAYENHKISQYWRIPETFVRAEEALGVSDIYTVLNGDGDPYSIRIYKDNVNIVAQEGTIRCTADWYSFEEREFCVFSRKSLIEKEERFILEYSNGKWMLPGDFDDSIRRDIIKQFADDNKPNCMMEEKADEELDNEDSESV